MKSFNQFEKPFGSTLASLGFTQPELTQNSGLWQASYKKGDIELLVMNDVEEVIVLCLISSISPVKNYGLNVIYDFIEGSSYQHTYYPPEILVAFLKKNLSRIEDMLSMIHHVDFKTKLDSFVQEYFVRKYPDVIKR